MKTSSELENDFKARAALYTKIVALLIALALLSVWSASINFGSVSANILIAVTIATIKATLVVLFFMGLREGKPVPAVIFFTSFAFLGIFLALTFVDASSRQRVAPLNPPKITTPFVYR